MRDATRLAQPSGSQPAANAQASIAVTLNSSGCRNRVAASAAAVPPSIRLPRAMPSERGRDGEICRVAPSWPEETRYGNHRINHRLVP
jgi:hypothetical protein